MSTSEIQFSNLGYIYLHRGEFRLASVAFKRSQAEEPLYCRSWLGNALLSEYDNSDNMSFLRHCHKLDSNYESQMMFANRVISQKQGGQDYRRDLTNALDCMKRTINYNSSSLEAQNTLGILLERLNFSQEAGKCFELAHLIEPKDSRVVFNILRQIRTIKSCPPEGLQPEIIKTAEVLADGGNLEYLLNFIYFLFYKGDFESINSKITRVIEKLPAHQSNHKIGAQILLAMSDRKAARDFKSWLFKNIIDSEDTICVESIISLFCLMLFGSLADDGNLVDQVSNDLIKCLIGYLSTRRIQFAELFYSLEGYWTRLLLFTSIFINQANLIRPLVALFPMVPDLWLYLGLSLMCRGSKLAITEYCIKRANLIGSTDPNLTTVCDILLAILSSHQRRKDTTTASIHARQRYLSSATSKCPNNTLLWDSLNKSRNSNEKIDYQNSELLQFAMEYTLQTLIIR